MGIAASQARYLYLTARQTNVEFEGQQINQARTNLANEEANIFQQIAQMELPTVPTQYDIQQKCDSWDATGGPQPSNYEGGTSNAQYIKDCQIYSVYKSTGSYTSAYNQAVAQYTQEKEVYDKSVDELNAKTEQIHQQDQVLEMQLRQLDTEQETIVTELESVKKVIDKNIELVFKTFDE